ncbi:MAG TPA: hypothetical protein VLD19_06465 [Chitinophagaceae bacterium]|nr:hypothetical protein [Chitinophagaceae bacterium]
MKTNITGLRVPEMPVSGGHCEKRTGFLQLLNTWVQTQEPIWEYNRLGISATGILLQVTAAGAMILILGAAGANPFIYTFGIFLAFMADSLAFAQARMRWVLATFVISIVLNLVLAVAYLLVLL